MATLRDAISVEADPDRQAVLYWELGRLAERAGDPAAAVKAYLSAYNQAPGFRPPLFDLIRIFERRRSFKNLARLYDAEYRSGRTEQDRASALADLAALLEDRGGDPDKPIERLQEALSAEPGPAQATAGLFLERSARRQGDRDLTIRALEARVTAATDPTWRAILTCDLADARAESGDEEDVRTAIEELESALEAGTARFRLLETMERIARRHDQPGALAQALEELGDLAAAVAKGENRDDGSGLFSAEHFGHGENAAGRAAAYYFEAASLFLQRLRAPTAAIEALRKATAVRPDDGLLRLVLVEAAHRAGDAPLIREQTSALLEMNEDGAQETAPAIVAALLYYAAHAAGAEGDEDAALATLDQALTIAPDSIVARATADAWMLASGRFDAWIETLAKRDGSGRDRTLALWRAATLAAHRLGDFPRARPLYEQAAEHAPERTVVLRDQYATATQRGDVDGVLDAIVALLPEVTNPEERSALLHHRYELLRTAGRDTEAAQTLTEALQLESARPWAADAARVYAARSGDMDLLATAHQTLAELAIDDVTAAAHLAATGRAAMKAGNEEKAIARLRAALDREPGNSYAIALLEEIYRARGDADEVVKLLRSAADARTDAHAAMVALLLAGAAAEASGDTALAAQTYDDARALDPTNVSPLWALARLAESTGDSELSLRAREALSEREVVEGIAGRATLELGEHLLAQGAQSEAESPLRGCLDGPAALEAATALATLHEGRANPVARVAGLEKLLTVAEPADAIQLRRELGATAAEGDLLPDVAEECAQALLENYEDRWALLTLLSSAARERRLGDRAELLLRLGAATDDARARAELTLHGLRAQVVGADARSEADEDAFLIAQELAAESDAAAAAVAVDETLSAGDDPEAFAEAQLGRVQHASEATRAAVAAAAGRALTAARKPEAFEVLTQVVAADPDDLAAWEALRVAARDRAQWPTVVKACDVLADKLDGDLRNELLEEAAAVLMDHLGREDLAEVRLREVVDADRRRPNAYHRLHDIVAERGDTDTLMGLVERRIAAIDDSTELERLYYEKARLHRGAGELDQALVAIENLRMLDEGHAGGLALAVEIHVSRSEWPEAVGALRALARADVPEKQKRIALLGAADFLESKLGDAVGALAQLEDLEKLGMADAKVYERMARIAEGAEMFPRAAELLQRAAEASVGPKRAAISRHAGELLRDRVGDSEGATRSFRDALNHVPTDVAAGDALAELLPLDEKEPHSRAFEAAVRADIDAVGLSTSHLRALARAARWRGDTLLETHALTALAAVGEATTDEARTAAERSSRSKPTRALSEAALAALRAPGDEGPVANLVELAYEPLCVAAGLQPGQLGVSRSDALSPRAAHPVREELANLAGVFGLDLDEVYQGGNHPNRVQAMPGKRAPTWVLGTHVDAPFDSLWRFLIGEQAMACLRRTTPLVRREPADAATLIHALAAAVDAPLSGGDRPGLVEWTHRVMKAMPRKIKKLLPDAIAAIGDTRSVEEFCRAARLTAMRAGLLLSADLRTVLTALLGGTAPGLDTVLGHDEARDLLHFWISPTMLELRRSTGL